MTKCICPILGREPICNIPPEISGEQCQFYNSDSGCKVTESMLLLDEIKKLLERIVNG